MITFQSVTKRFGEDQPALENVSFQVEPGEFLFLTGQSGSGKTTLLKLLTKEYAPTEGEIEFQGVPLSQIKGSQIHKHRRSIGVVFQDYRLLSDLNVWENIALALQIIGKKQTEIEERVTDLLELVQLTDKAYHFPAQLSGGESQRIGIARALATAPSVLLADEPTGNLDPQNTLMIARLFDRIHQLGTTVLFATHDTNILGALKHRRLVLDKGKLISDSGKDAKTQESKPKDDKMAVKAPPVVNQKVATAPKEKPVTEVVASIAEKTPPKKRGFHFPKLSLPFGRKKTTVMPPEVIATETQPISPSTESTKKEPEIKQENLDGSAPKSAEHPKNKKELSAVVAVESLQAEVDDKEAKAKEPSKKEKK